MKQIIAILRLLGIISLVAFIILRITNYLSVAKVVLSISLGCFVIVILLQLYRYYIQNYFKKEDTRND